MSITLEPTAARAQAETLRRYTDRVGLVDTYWENQILAAQLYSLCLDGEEVGFCSFLEDQRALTSFCINDPLFRYSREVFAALLAELRPALGYLVTGDGPFLSLCLDVGARLEAHGYFFHDSGRECPPAAFPSAQVLPAGEGDLEALRETRFYDDLHDPENPLYVLRDSDGAFLGTGHIAKWMQKLGKNWGAVGMYTAPSARGRGVGRSIILAMKEFTREMGLEPIAGCYCQNTASRRTLESCGFVTNTRYVKAWF